MIDPMNNLAPELIERLLKYLRYPDEWSLPGLYPEEIAVLQLEEVLRELGVSREAFASLPPDHFMELGSEHFRTATILYWVRRPRAPEITAALKSALRSDPHKPMAKSFLRELEGQAP